MMNGAKNCVTPGKRVKMKKGSMMRGAPPKDGYTHLGRFKTGIPRKEYPRP